MNIVCISESTGFFKDFLSARTLRCLAGFVTLNLVSDADLSAMSATLFLFFTICSKCMLVSTVDALGGISWYRRHTEHPSICTFSAHVHTIYLLHLGACMCTYMLVRKYVNFMYDISISNTWGVDLHPLFLFCLLSMMRFLVLSKRFFSKKNSPASTVFLAEVVCLPLFITTMPQNWKIS